MHASNEVGAATKGILLTTVTVAMAPSLGSTQTEETKLKKKKSQQERRARERRAREELLDPRRDFPSVEAAVETEVAPEEAPAAEEAALIECAHCKLQIPAIAKFCPDCGKKLRQE